MSAPLDAAWVGEAAARVTARFERELEPMVGISSPSGDVAAADEMCALVAAMVPAAAELERPACSTEGYGRDLLATVTGTGSGRLLLLGHLDTVIAHEAHRPLERADGRLTGSGTVDMKGGVALAIGVMSELAARPGAFAEVCLLTVVDEEWRTGGFSHGPRFREFDACLCFEAGQLAPDGTEALVAKRKAAGTLRVRAEGVAAHAGSSPEKGRNALLALAEAAQAVAGRSDPAGPDHLTATPTVIESGGAFNVVPDSGELTCDVRADSLAAFQPVLAAVPREVGGVRVEAELVRQWPGMDSRELVAQRLAGPAAELAGMPIAVGARGGASDASHMAEHVALTVDGLGPRGGHAHHPDEYVTVASVEPRARVALAVAAAALSA